jgi:hypothetical protein
MAEQTLSIYGKLFWRSWRGFGSIGLPTISASLADADWTSAGWTRVTEIQDDGIEVSFIHNGKMKRPLGSLMPTGKLVHTQGIDSIKFAIFQNRETDVELALPTWTTTSGGITGSKTVVYVSLAIQSDTSVIVAKKAAATGKLVQKFTNEDWTNTPYEFDCFEDDTESSGTPNWVRYKVS